MARRIFGLIAALMCWGGASAEAFAQFDGAPGSRARSGALPRTRALNTRPATTTVQLTGGQTISNNTWTTISWSTTALRDDVGAFKGSSPTVITAPPGQSCVRLTVHTVWENGAAGVYRFVQVDTSGYGGAWDGPGGGNITISIKASNNEAGDNLTTPIMCGLVAGQTFSIQVLHNKGSNSVFSPAAGFSQAYMQAEWWPQ